MSERAVRNKLVLRTPSAKEANVGLKLGRRDGSDLAHAGRDRHLKFESILARAPSPWDCPLPLLPQGRPRCLSSSRGDRPEIGHHRSGPGWLHHRPGPNGEVERGFSDRPRPLLVRVGACYGDQSRRSLPTSRLSLVLIRGLVQNAKNGTWEGRGLWELLRVKVRKRGRLIGGGRGRRGCCGR